MNKPVILEIKEIEDKIIQILNEYDVPAFFLVRSLRNLLNELEKKENYELQYLKEKEKQEQDEKKNEKKDELMKKEVKK